MPAIQPVRWRQPARWPEGVPVMSMCHMCRGALVCGGRRSPSGRTEPCLSVDPCLGLRAAAALAFRCGRMGPCPLGDPRSFVRASGSAVLPTATSVWQRASLKLAAAAGESRVAAVLGRLHLSQVVPRGTETRLRRARGPPRVRLRSECGAALRTVLACTPERFRRVSDHLPPILACALGRCVGVRLVVPGTLLRGDMPAG